MPSRKEKSSTEKSRPSPVLQLFEIERYALNDGPGIRSVVFFKGCPLRCQWCSNPESQLAKPVLFYRENLCIRCGNCINACPLGAISSTGGGVPAQGISIDRNLCDACGRCVETCYTGALTLAGSEWSVDQAMEVILRDETYYRSSGGGVTFSGGEPTSQPEGLAALAARCRWNGLHTCMETCGYFSWETAGPFLEEIDLVLYDLKHMDTHRHRELTGVGNELILDNFIRLVSSGRETAARLPIIPGANDDEANLEATADFLKNQAPGIRVDLLPYHRLGNSKYPCLGMEYTLPGAGPLSDEKISRIAALFADRGLSVRVEG